MSNNNVQSNRCGHVAIIGKPNVGKSTLLNRLIGQKISITTRKPQTTRHHILGITNIAEHQIIYIDTPGIQSSPKKAMNRYMNRQALNVIDEVDLLIVMVEALNWTANDDVVMQSLKHSSVERMLIINKVDRVTDKTQLLPFIDQIKDKFQDDEIMSISALSANDVERLQTNIIQYLPFADRLYDSEQITNRSSRFLSAELIREKLIQKLGDELPYESTVTIDSFKQSKNIVHIHATIWVERRGQKAIVIGKNGSVLKSIGEQARGDIESLLGQKVFLETWVKHKGKWTDDETALKRLEYDI